jgi:predicted acyltransferase
MIWPTEPEGLFSTFSAFLNPYCGILFHKMISSHSESKGQTSLLKRFAILSLSLTTIGFYTLFWELPIKKIWNTSFAFSSAGISSISLSICFFLVEIL